MRVFQDFYVLAECRLPFQSSSSVCQESSQALIGKTVKGLLQEICDFEGHNVTFFHWKMRDLIGHVLPYEIKVLILDLFKQNSAKISPFVPKRLLQSKNCQKFSKIRVFSAKMIAKK